MKQTTSICTMNVIVQKLKTDKPNECKTKLKTEVPYVQ